MELAITAICFVDDCRPESAVCPAKLYIESGFVSIQYAIDSAILEVKFLILRQCITVVIGLISQPYL